MERLDELCALCEVLGADYLEKLDLIGIVPGDDVPAEALPRKQEKVFKIIEIMQEAKQERFPVFKELAEKLLDMWVYHKTPAAKVLQFPEVFVLLDAVTADQIVHDKVLSTSTKKNMDKELSSLEVAKHDKMRKKYLMKKDKLLSLVLKTHLLLSDFDYDAERKVEPANYKTETKQIKQKIKLVKAQAMIRKDIVLRMELIQHCVSQKLDSGKIKELIKVLRGRLDKFLGSQGPFMFEGEELAVYLDNMEADSQREMQESIDASNKIKASLRSHPKQVRTPRVPV